MSIWKTSVHVSISMWQVWVQVSNPMWQGLNWKIRLKRNKKWSKRIFPFTVLLLVGFFNCLEFALPSTTFPLSVIESLHAWQSGSWLFCVRFRGFIWGFICSRGFICIVFTLRREVYDPLIFSFMMLCFYRWHCMLLCDVPMFEFEVGFLFPNIWQCLWFLIV